MRKVRDANKIQNQMGVKKFLRKIEPEIISAAKKSDVEYSKHAAVLIDRNTRFKLLSIGSNRHHTKTSTPCTKDRNGSFTVHAEVDAILQRIKYVKSSSVSSLVIYVVRIA